MTNRKRLIARSLAALTLVAAGAAQAQYPNKPIKWIVPYTPGGITDTVTRLVTQKIQEAVGQPVIVENKPGANSIIGADLVAKAAPDGYTIVTVIAAHAANATLYAGKLPFDPVKSFVPIACGHRAVDHDGEQQLPAEERHGVDRTPRQIRQDFARSSTAPRT
jgi:tripartite-type tricarboxylate transporter receptor subunit TctC